MTWFSFRLPICPGAGDRPTWLRVFEQSPAPVSSSAPLLSSAQDLDQHGEGGKMQAKSKDSCSQLVYSSLPAPTMTLWLEVSEDGTLPLISQGGGWAWRLLVWPSVNHSCGGRLETRPATPRRKDLMRPQGPGQPVDTHPNVRMRLKSLSVV